MHELSIRVYYEDTDLAGIVYYANYLKFIERGRTEALRAAGIDQMAVRAETGIVFAVRRIAADFLAPARMDDLLKVRTATGAIGGARVTLTQTVERGTTRLFEAEVTIVALKADGSPARIPSQVREALAGIGA